MKVAVSTIKEVTKRAQAIKCPLQSSIKYCNNKHNNLLFINRDEIPAFEILSKQTNIDEPKGWFFYRHLILAKDSFLFFAFTHASIFCDRKIFVGGIPATTTRSKLMQYFGEYGEIDDCIIMMDRDHKPRGFGFVTFCDLSSIDDVLADDEHYIDGKLVECKKAVPKETS